MKALFSPISLFYIALSLIYLAGLLLFPEQIQFYLKCTLVPALIAATLLSPKFENRNLLLIALVFCWIGDVVISFAPRGNEFFLAGLISFLIGHVCYILLFYRLIRLYPQNRGYLATVWGGAVLFALVFIVLLVPRAGALAIPICIYAAAITTMFILAVKGYSHWQLDYGPLIVAGAGAFVLSDALLAINKFHTPFPFAPVAIMVTYLFAQWAITHGVLRLGDSTLAAE